MISEHEITHDEIGTTTAQHRRYMLALRSQDVGLAAGAFQSQRARVKGAMTVCVSTGRNGVSNTPTTRKHPPVKLIIEYPFEPLTQHMLHTTVSPTPTSGRGILLAVCTTEVQRIDAKK